MANNKLILSTEPIFYVYQYLRPNLTPYYIGKGKGNRMYKKHENTLPKDTAFIKLVAHRLSEHEAFLLERRLIKFYGRMNNKTGILHNLTEGGAGTSGHTQSPEIRALISSAHKGKAKSLDHRAKLSAALKNRKLSPDHCAKIGSGHRGLKRSAEFSAKMSILHKGKVVSPETRAKISAANKGRKASPETTLKRLAALRIVISSPEHRARQSAALMGNQNRKGWKNV